MMKMMKIKTKIQLSTSEIAKVFLCLKSNKMFNSNIIYLEIATQLTVTAQTDLKIQEASEDDNIYIVTIGDKIDPDLASNIPTKPLLVRLIPEYIILAPAQGL